MRTLAVLCALLFGRAVFAVHFSELPQNFPPIDPPPKVGLYDETCPGQELPKLWAQKMVNADLAIEYVQKNFSSVPVVKVAVVDTGMDPQTLPLYEIRPRMEPLPRTMSNFFRSSKSLSSDFAGHGTSVAPLISGKYGIGINPWASVTSYKDSEGLASSWKTTIERTVLACESGNKIINVSSASDELSKQGRDAFTEFAVLRDGRWVKVSTYLLEKGCIVVQGAGNTNLDTVTEMFQTLKTLVGEKNSEPEMSPVIKIGGVDWRGTRAQWATRGEINAPAQGVLTIVHSQQKTEQECLGNGFDFVSGTSYATPISSGAVSLVSSVLATNPSFSELRPSLQGYTLLEILRMSAQQGYVDSYRGVRLAHSFLQARRGAWTLQDYSEVKSELANADQHLENTACRLATSNRERLSVCPSQIAEVEMNVRNEALNDENWWMFFQSLARSQNRKIIVDSDELAKIEGALIKSSAKLSDRLERVAHLHQFTGQVSPRLQAIVRNDLNERLRSRKPISFAEWNAVERVSQFMGLSPEIGTALFQQARSQNWLVEYKLKLAQRPFVSGPEKAILLHEVNEHHVDQIRREIAAAAKKDWNYRNESAQRQMWEVKTGQLRLNMITNIADGEGALTAEEFQILQKLSVGPQRSDELANQALLALALRAGNSQVPAREMTEFLKQKLSQRASSTEDFCLVVLGSTLKGNIWTPDQRRDLLDAMSQSWFAPLSSFIITESMDVIDPSERVEIVQKMIRHATAMKQTHKNKFPVRGLEHIARAIRQNKWDQSAQGQKALADLRKLGLNE